MNQIVHLILKIFAFLACFWSSMATSELKRSRRSAVGPRWPTKQIPFTFEDGEYFHESNRGTIKNALKMMQESLAVNGDTCIEFIERTNESDFVKFIKRDGCYTYVGYRPGENVISLGSQCVNTGTILHETLHKLGFDHEHSRSDRDQNIHVLLNNTRLGDQFELTSRHQETDLEAPYDFNSIVHYTSYQGAKGVFGNNPVLLSKLPVLISNTNEIEFEREFLSPIDIYKIQRFYKCPTIPMPKIVNQTEQDVTGVGFEQIVKRFAIETMFKGVTDDVMFKLVWFFPRINLELNRF